MGRRPCCCKEDKLNRGSWTVMEDKTLIDYITLHGEGHWRDLPKKAGLKRCGKSCRLRWLNYLRPDIKRGNISHDEKDLIVRLHKLLGNRWSLIAGRLPGRTDNEIKNYWNTNIGKKNAQTSIVKTESTPNLKPASNQQKDFERNVASPTNNAQPFVIKTKATRCTKVILPPYDRQRDDQLITNKLTVESTTTVRFHVLEPSSDKLTVQNHDDHMMNPSQPSDFMKCLEMDDRFLSDLLNADISLFRGFDGDDQLQANTCNNSIISTSDPATHLSDINDHNLYDQDLQTMASFLDSELNWFLN